MEGKGIEEKEHKESRKRKRGKEEKGKCIGK